MKSLGRGSRLCECMALALMRVCLWVSLCLLLFSQDEGLPGDQSVLKAHTGADLSPVAGTGST